MEINNSDLAIQVKQLFMNYQLVECLEKVNSYNIDMKDIQKYQIVHLYKFKCYQELGQINDANYTYKNLIEQSLKYKGDLVEEIDHMNDEDEKEALSYNVNLYKTCYDFKQQNEGKQTYNHGIYEFGMGMYNFIQTRQDKNNLECIELLKICLNSLLEYNQDIINLIGWMYDYKKMFKEAIEWYERIYDINPRYPGLTNNLALQYWQFNNYEKSEQLFLEAEQYCSNNPIIILNFALFYKQYNKEKAQQYFQKAQSADPKYITSYLQYGLFLYDNVSKEDGLKKLEEGLDVDPRNKNMLLQLFKLYCEDNNDKYKEVIQKCIDFYPTEGNHLLNIDQYENALDYYTQSLQLTLKPQQILLAESKIGFCLYELGRYTESLSQYFKTYNLDIKEDLTSEVDSICYILDEAQTVPLEQKISLISNQYGPFQMRLLPLIVSVSDKKINSMLKQKLDEYMSILEIIVYKKKIQPYLTYQSNYCNWDVYID